MALNGNFHFNLIFLKGDLSLDGSQNIYNLYFKHINVMLYECVYIRKISLRAVIVESRNWSRSVTVFI